MNKKAGAPGDFLLWLFRFIMTILVVIGIIAMTSVLYSKQFDIRQVEATAMNEKIMSCNLFTSENFKPEKLSECIKIDENEEYINLTAIINGNQKSIYIGDKVLEETCKLAMQYKIKPFCQKNIYYILFKQDNFEQATLKSLIVIRKAEKNAL